MASRINSGELLKYHCVSATWTWPRYADKIGRRRSGSRLDRYHVTRVLVANRWR